MDAVHRRGGTGAQIAANCARRASAYTSAMARHRRRTLTPRLTRHEVPIAGLDPRHDGVRIAHLSDLHVGRVTGAEQIEEAVALANFAQADVIVMTGDFVTYARHEVALLNAQIGGLRAPHVVTVLGNHDYYCDGVAIKGVLESKGYAVLRNQFTTVQVRGAPLHLIGVDDPVTRQHDLDAAFRSLPDVGTRVVLCHGPELAPKIAGRGSDLILSGHTHGGHIFIRGVTDKIASRLGLRFLSGFYPVKDALLYVTPGIGSSSVPFRVGDTARSEVAVHTLRRDEPV